MLIKNGLNDIFGGYMAKISDIIFCLKATNIQGEGASAHSILSVISPEYVPGLFSFSVIVNLLDVDLNKTHNFNIDFESPSKEKIVNVNGELPIINEYTNLPLDYQGITIAMDWNNVNFKSSGVYELKFSIDDELVGSKEIFVKGKNE